MTIRELAEHLDQRIKEEKKLASEAPSKYSEGLHDGNALTLQGVLYYLTLLEGYNEGSSN